MRVHSTTLLLLGSITGCAYRRPNVSFAQEVPITRVVLFQNGMAYYERRGPVSGAELELNARRDTLDDVLKSMTVVDHGGGRVASVRVLPADASAPVVTVRLGLAGGARHDVAISYIAPASGWRPTYRLLVQERGTVRLQGFAVLDNRSGERWSDVSLALSTELPVSFAYELNAPRLPDRPHFTSDGRLRPVLAPADEGPNLALGGAQPAFDARGVQGAYAMANIAMPEHSSRAGRVVSARTRVPIPSATPQVDGQNEPPASPSATAAPGPSLGAPMAPLQALESQHDEQGFLLESPTRFSLGPSESGMVPYVDTATAGDAVLLYKPATASGPSSRRMYRAVLFQNPLDAPLLTGPVSVYAQGRFAGDAVTAVIPQRTHAFVAYALEPSVEVRASETTAEDELRAVELTGGYLTVESTSVRRHHFALASTAPWRERAFLFVAREIGYEPRALPDGSIRNEAGVYVPVTGQGPSIETHVDLVQRQRPRVHIAVEPTHAYVPALLAMLEGRPEGAPVVARLREIATSITRLREEQERLERDLEVFRRAAEEHRASLDALRSVPANAALRARIAARLGEAVAQADEHTRRRVAASAEEVALRGEWYARLRDLTIASRDAAPRG